MKAAVTISFEDAFTQALVVFRGLEKSLPIIADLGYDGIELAMWNEANIEVATLKKLLSDHDLRLPVISTGQVFTLEKCWFTHPVAEQRRRSIEVMKGIIRFASEFGAAVNISRVRGSIPPEVRESEGYEWLDNAVTELADYAEPLGVTLLLEQMNMFETNILFSVEEVGSYIHRLGRQNVKIHADTFHMNIHDVDMCGVLDQYSDLLGYVHLADSNRLSPGSGHIDFGAILATLSRVGYSGWIGVEVFTKPTPEAAARDAITHIRRLLHKD